MTPLERAIADGDLPRAQSIQAAKARAKASARARRKSRSPRAAGPARAPVKGSSALRAEVFVRCGGSTLTHEDGSIDFIGEGYCEACGTPLGIAWDMHHTLSGGQRRSRQALGNVVAICWDCHRRAHRGDLGTLAQIAQVPGLDAEAQAAVRRRIAKIERARRTPSVPIRVEVKNG